MKIKAIKVFDDLMAKVTRKENEVFEVTPERFKEINGSAYGTLAVEVNDEPETATGEEHETSKKKTNTKRTAVTDKK